jgi:hypothetical protein
MSDKDDVGKDTMDNVTEEQLVAEFKEASKGGDGWWEDRSLPAKIVMGVGFGILGIIFVALLILLIMTVWNRVMPAIFNLPLVTYWQTVGLVFLSCVFFKNCGNTGNSSKKSERRRKRELRKYMEDQPGAES